MPGTGTLDTKMTDFPFKIAIPSRARGELILENPLLSIAHVVVDNQREYDSYVNAGVPEERLVSMRGECRNISQVRQWILDNLWSEDEPFIMQVDDDFVGMIPMMKWKAEVISNPADVAAIFWESYISASDIGAGVFGYCFTANPRTRASWIPVWLRSWVKDVTGVIDRSLKYDPSLFLAEDIDLCLQAQLRPHQRILWKDDRFAPHVGKSWNYGGIAATRTEERRHDSYAMINKKYGRNTISEKFSTTTGHRINVSVNGHIARNKSKNS